MLGDDDISTLDTPTVHLSLFVVRTFPAVVVVVAVRLRAGVVVLAEEGVVGHDVEPVARVELLAAGAAHEAREVEHSVSSGATNEIVRVDQVIAAGAARAKSPAKNVIQYIKCNNPIFCAIMELKVILVTRPFQFSDSQVSYVVCTYCTACRGGLKVQLQLRAIH